MQPRIAAIREKLLRLISIDTEFKIFGSNEPWNGHKYVLNDTLTPEEILNFEQYAEVKLPEEYAQFLTHIANGDAGPCYGLYYLNEAVDQTKSRVTKTETQEEFIRCFAKFPVSKTKADEYAKLISGLHDEYVEIYLEPDFPSTIEHTESLTGVLFLSEYGCGGYYVLVICGECAGQVWFFQSGEFLAPICKPNGSIVSFLDWYEDWLDASLKVVSSC